MNLILPRIWREGACWNFLEDLCGIAPKGQLFDLAFL